MWEMIIKKKKCNEEYAQVMLVERSLLRRMDFIYDLDNVGKTFGGKTVSLAAGGKA